MSLKTFLRLFVLSSFLVCILFTAAHAQAEPTQFLALDHKGVLYVAYSQNGTVHAEYHDGTKVTLATNLGEIGGMVLGHKRDIFVSSSSTGVIYCIERNGALRKVCDCLNQPGALTIDRDGTLIVATKDKSFVTIPGYRP